MDDKGRLGPLPILGSITHVPMSTPLFIVRRCLQVRSISQGWSQSITQDDVLFSSPLTKQWQYSNDPFSILQLTWFAQFFTFHDFFVPVPSIATKLASMPLLSLGTNLLLVVWAPTFKRFWKSWSLRYAKFKEISPLRHRSSTSLPSLSACEGTCSCQMSSLQDHAFPAAGLQFDKIWWMCFPWVQHGGKTGSPSFVKMRATWGYPTWHHATSIVMSRKLTLEKGT